MYFKVSYIHYGQTNFQTLESANAEIAQQIILARKPGAQILSVVEAPDPTVFNPTLFRKEFRDSVKRLDEDAVADYHEKVSSGEIVLNPASPAPEETQTSISIDVAGQYEVGSIVEHNGEHRLCTWSGYISSEDAIAAEEGFDVFIAPGWRSTLVRLDADVMRVLSEQYAAGQAQFTHHDTVKFPDEDAHNIRELRYSKELGF